MSPLRVTNVIVAISKTTSPESTITAEIVDTDAGDVPFPGWRKASLPMMAIRTSVSFDAAEEDRDIYKFRAPLPLRNLGIKQAFPHNHFIHKSYRLSGIASMRFGMAEFL